MTTHIPLREIRERRRQVLAGLGYRIERFYEYPADKVLSAVDLEQADTDKEDSDARIVSVERVLDRGHNGGVSNLLKVTSFKPVAVTI